MLNLNTLREYVLKYYASVTLSVISDHFTFKQKSWKVIEIYLELHKNLGVGILAEDTLLGAEHLSPKALISYS